MKDIVIHPSGALEPWEYEGLAEYLELVVRKLEKSRKDRGMSYLDKNDADFIAEINEELIDLNGWAATRFLRLKALTRRSDESLCNP